MRFKAKNTKAPELEIIDPTLIVTCIYCKKEFDRSKESFKLVSEGKFAHTKCYETEQNRELTDEEKLNRYIMKLFKSDYVYPKIKKQIKSYVNDCGFTYSGILKALVYYYEVKGNPFDEIKSGGGIGIVAYVYQQAYNYYYAIWEAQQRQNEVLEGFSIQDFIPKTVEITIPVPKRQALKRKLFTFLDDKGE